MKRILSGRPRVIPNASTYHLVEEPLSIYRSSPGESNLLPGSADIDVHFDSPFPMVVRLYNFGGVTGK